MAIEIERKFLVKSAAWRMNASSGIRYRQGYLSTDKHFTIRARIAEDRAFLTLKGLPSGISRQEYNIEIPIEDAEEILLNLCDRPPVEKTRYMVEEAGMTWEVDVFSGTNNGLIVAEIELRTENQFFQLPDWVGEEITHDNRYLNVNLYVHPFRKWSFLM